MLNMFISDQGIEPRCALSIEVTEKKMGSMDLVQNPSAYTTMKLGFMHKIHAEQNATLQNVKCMRAF